LRKSEKADGEEIRKELEVNDIDLDLISKHDHIVLLMESVPEDFEG